MATKTKTNEQLGQIIKKKRAIELGIKRWDLMIRMIMVGEGVEAEVVVVEYLTWRDVGSDEEWSKMKGGQGGLIWGAKGKAACALVPSGRAPQSLDDPEADWLAHHAKTGKVGIVC